jgi:hypothetical protein
MALLFVYITLRYVCSVGGAGPDRDTNEYGRFESGSSALVFWYSLPTPFFLYATLSATCSVLTIPALR